MYANHNLRLDRIQVYGFDYDYTLAHYTEELQSLIYKLAKEHLVHEVSCLARSSLRNPVVPFFYQNSYSKTSSHSLCCCECNYSNFLKGGFSSQDYRSNSFLFLNYGDPQCFLECFADLCNM